MKNIKEYCIIGMDNVVGLEDDIILISKETPKTLVGAKESAMISIFKTDLEIEKIKEILNVGGKRSFFISELNPSTFAAHIDENNVNEFMFGRFNKIQESFLTVKDKLFDLINNKSSITPLSEEDHDSIYDEQKILSLSEEERTDLMDRLLSSNVNNLTNNQKKILNFLASL